MAVKASVDTSNQTTVRVGQQNATQVTSTQTGITYAANAGTAFNVVGGISSVTQLSVSGISTLGIVTAIRYYGDGSNLTGTGNTTDVSTNSLVVLGISTLGITSATNLEAQQLIVTGISTLGITSATDLEAQQLNISGVSTFAGDLTISSTFPRIYLTDTNSDSDFSIFNGNGTFTIKDETNATNRIRLFSGGGVQIDGNLDATAGLDVTGHTETDTFNVSGVSTFNKDVEFVGEGGVGITSAYWDQDASSLKFLDGVKAQFGNHNDLSIYHTTASGGYSVISEAGTGQLVIGGNIIEFKNEGLGATYAQIDGTGIDVTGHTETDTLKVSGVSTFTGIVTTGNDLYVGGDLYVSDDVVLDELTAINLSLIHI